VERCNGGSRPRGVFVGISDPVRSSASLGHGAQRTGGLPCLPLRQVVSDAAERQHRGAPGKAMDVETPQAVLLQLPFTGSTVAFRNVLMRSPICRILAARACTNSATSPGRTGRAVVSALDGMSCVAFAV